MEKLVAQIIPSRWLEVVGATFFVFNLFIHFHIVTFLLYIIFCTAFWPLFLISLCWMYYDRMTPYRGGRQSRMVKRNPLWKHFNNYFPITLVKTSELDPRKNYIFCTHPHGVVCTSNIGNFMNGYSTAAELFPGLRFHTATLNVNFYFPILRDYAMAFGFVSASSDSLKYILDESHKGNVVNLMIGGAAETLLTKEGRYNIILKKRKGFIKIALSTGCCLVPVVCFGENDHLQLTPPLPGTFACAAQEWFKKLTGVTCCLPTGRSWLFKLLPKRMPMATVVGKPIEIPKIPEPTQDVIEHYHSTYIEALCRLFDEYKHKYVRCPEDSQLLLAE